MSLPLDEVAWSSLAEAVDLVGGRFSLHAVEALSPFIAVELARRFTDAGRPAHLDRFTGDQAAAHPWQPPPADVWIITPEERDEGPLTRGWQHTFRGLNRERNHLQRTFPHALVVVGPPWFHRLAWEEASDLWSGRDGPYRFPLPPELAGLPDRFEPWVAYQRTAPELCGPEPEVTTLPALVALLEARAHRLEALGFAREADLWRVRALTERARFSDRRPLMEALLGMTQGDPRLATRARLEWVRLAEDCLDAPVWQAEVAAIVPGADRLDALILHITGATLHVPVDDVRHHLKRVAEVAEAEAPPAWSVAHHVVAARLARTRLGDLEGAARHVEAARARLSDGEPEAVTPWLGGGLPVEIEAELLADLNRPAAESAEAWARLARQAEGDPALVDGCLTMRAGALQLGGESQAAEQIVRELIALAEARGDGIARLASSRALAELLSLHGEAGPALGLWRAIASDYEALGDLFARARALGGVANALHQGGGQQEALPIYRGLLVELERLGQWDQRGAVLRSIARVLRELGEPDAALALYREALALAEARGRPGSRAAATVDIAHILTLQSEAPAALGLLREAQATFEALGDRRGVAAVRYAMAHLLKSEGRSSEAAVLLREALADYEAVGARRERATALAGLARIIEGQGEVEEALVLHREALSEFQALGHRRDSALAQVRIAHNLVLAGKSAEAEALLREALLEFEAMGDRPQRTDVLLNLALLAFNQHQHEAAIRWSRLALQAGRALASPDVVAEAGRLLLQLPGAVQPQARFALRREVAAALRKLGKDDLIEGLNALRPQPTSKKKR